MGSSRGSNEPLVPDPDAPIASSSDASLAPSSNDLLARKILLGDNKALTELKQCFRQLRQEKNLVDRQYKILREAEQRQIPLEKFELMFAQYCNRRAWNRRADGGLRKITDIVGQLSILFGLVLFVTEADSRKQQANEQAWGVIIAAQRAQATKDVDGMGDASHLGRIAALESLNQGCREAREESQQPFWMNLLPWEWSLWHSKCATLQGLWLTGVHLPNVKLPYATLRNTNFRETGLWSADFREADLSDAILERALLNESDFSGANLTGANLKGANLAGVSLDGAILLDTNFTNSRDEIEGTLLKRTRLTQNQLATALICGAQFPKNVRPPADDCSEVKAELHKRYPDQFADEETAGEFVDELLERKQAADR
ncbi:MAG: pentapeptide repeat-containing protein [Cyanobacteria bacterium P01_D01_bin.1]